jgi:hypothetical protein
MFSSDVESFHDLVLTSQSVVSFSQAAVCRRQLKLSPTTRDAHSLGDIKHQPGAARAAQAWSEKYEGAARRLPGYAAEIGLQIELTESLADGQLILKFAFFFLTDHRRA